MVKIDIHARQLHEIEKELNRIQFKGFGIGSALSFYFDRLYGGDFDNCFFRNFVYFVYYFIKSIGKKKYLKDYHKSIFYFKTGKHRHYKEMEDAITYDKDLSKKTLVIGPEGFSGLCNGKVFFTSGLIDLFKIVVFIIANNHKMSASLKPLHLNLRTSSTLYICLVMQMLKARSLNRFFMNQSSIELIGADYDRGSYSSLFFVVSKSLKIKSFTFQHGVINPPVGYSPINADEIWVWGEMARLQLMELGVDEKQIIKIGTPIIKDLKISNELRETVLKKYKLKHGKTIVLALSSQNKANDLKMVEFLAEIKKEYGTSIDNYLVKIHPAREYSYYSWINVDFNIEVLPQNITFENFMNITDVLLAHSSGIATEALYYEKKVGILDILEESPGNGLELHKYFKVPLLKTTNEFKRILEDTEWIIDSHMAYYKTGAAATEEIIMHVKHIID